MEIMELPIWDRLSKDDSNRVLVTRESYLDQYLVRMVLHEEVDHGSYYGLRMASCSVIPRAFRQGGGQDIEEYSYVVHNQIATEEVREFQVLRLGDGTGRVRRAFGKGRGRW